MALHAAGDLSVAEFRATLGALGIAQHRVAQLFGVGPRSVRRWRDGTRRVPVGVSIVFRLLATGAVTVDQVEQAAVPIPARTNGSTEEEPPAPLRAASAPEEQSASAPRRARTAALAERDLTTAEKVAGLSATACRWPYNEPGQPGFHFCSDPIAKESYCQPHYRMAHLLPRPGRGHSVRIVHGRHGRPPIPRAPKILFDRAAPPPA
jgi:hypothetical protein